LSLVLGRWEIRPFGQGKQNDLRAFFLNLACVGSVVSDRWPVAGVGSDELLGPGTGETSCHRGVASQASSQLSKADAPPGGAHTTNGRGNGSHRTQPLLKEVGALPRSVPCVSFGPDFGWERAGQGHLGRVQRFRFCVPAPEIGGRNVAMGWQKYSRL